MSDKRRAEIEAKKAKLNELRKARAERQKAEAEKRQEVRTMRRALLASYLLTSRRFSAPRRAKQMY
jgi:Skp family chaperone for outer membrane proteins